MEKAIVSLSFDDGRGDNLSVFQDILMPMQIPVTINITTGYVDGSCPADLSPSSKPSISVDAVKQLAQSPLVEIAMHGDQHLNTEEDIAKGREKLIEWLDLPKDCALGFASPGSGLSVEQFVKSESTLFLNQMSYMRTSLRIKKNRFLRVMCRKVGRVFHIPFLYRIAYADTLMDTCKDRVVYSIPVMKDTTYGQIKAIIDLAIKRKCAVTLMFHSILENTESEDNWSWKRVDFQYLCQYLIEKSLNGDLEILTTWDMLRRLQG